MFVILIVFILRLLPKLLRDMGYDSLGSIRYRLFGKTQNVCPIIPPELRSRFL